MEDSKATVPYAVYEGTQIRNERTVKRLIVALVIALLIIFATNAAWLYAWSRYDYSSDQSVSVDGKNGIANYIGNDGEINNGEDSGEENKNAP